MYIYTNIYDIRTCYIIHYAIPYYTLLYSTIIYYYYYCYYYYYYCYCHCHCHYYYYYYYYYDYHYYIGAAVASSKTLIWNGPMGVFEMTAFEAGPKTTLYCTVLYSTNIYIYIYIHT